MGIYLVRSVENLITGNNCSSNLHGISIWNSSKGNTFERNTCVDNSYGILLQEDSDHNLFLNNSCDRSYFDGIYVGRGGRNLVLGSNFTNGDFTIVEFPAEGTTFFNNTFLNNSWGRARFRPHDDGDGTGSFPDRNTWPDVGRNERDTLPWWVSLLFYIWFLAPFVILSFVIAVILCHLDIEGKEGRGRRS